MHTVTAAFENTRTRRAYVARPTDREPRGVVAVAMEIFGVNAHIEAVTRDVAALGYVAVAPDFLDGRIFDYGDLTGARAAFAGQTDETMLADLDAALAHGVAVHGAPDARAVLGFCMGGRLAYRAACARSLRAAVCYYGGGIAVDPRPFGPPPVERTADITGGVLLHFGARDPFIPLDRVGLIADALRAAGRDHALALYPDVGHGFHCPDRADFDAVASVRAWAMTAAFLAGRMAP
ncbi:dienelactone hydrolase family protein [Myxococcota bacterium]|nr:dienelactone hydrolase family protein [Myxococcota bacterium]